MKTNPVVSFNNITLLKNGVPLFEDFNFSVCTGEHWVIQGENGAGKTLLLQLIAGTIHPTAGEMQYSFIDGDNWDVRARQRSEGIHLIPTHWLQTFLGGSDGAFYQQRYYAMGETLQPRVRDLLGEASGSLPRFEVPGNFDVHTLLDLPVTRLSNGQLKKLVILRELARNIPRLLLLDYPFDGLDAESRGDLIRFIDRLVLQFGIQILMVDHGEELPAVINRRLTLDRFRVKKIEARAPTPTAERSPAPMPATNGAVSGEVVVEMQNVTVRYGSRKILSDISWKIRRGERWALTGRNGSGKTTLFSLIYADHPMAYSQKVFLFGKRRGSGESIWDIKKRIHYFGPEQIHFLQVKTIRTSAREYILSRPDRNISRLGELIDFFEAGAYIDQPFYSLSSGQLQMAMLINLFIDGRELLLLDEPFQFLDPPNHARLSRFLQHYLGSNVTLVLITHDENDVNQWTKMRMSL